MRVICSNQIIVFKSNDEFFEKERDGRKANTVRRIPMDEWEDFNKWRNGPKWLRQVRIIRASNPDEWFDRYVSDVSAFMNCRADINYIISWRHEE